MIKPNLKANYEVEFRVVKRAHKLITSVSPDVMLDSVTKILGVHNKPALVPWASREAANNIRLALLNRLKGKEDARVKLTESWIEEVIQEGRKAPDAIKNEAARIGTMLHGIFFDIINGQPPKVDESYQGAADAFDRYMAGCGIEIIGAEFPVASERYGFGGVPDALGKTADGKYGVLDWKTSSGVYPEMAYQTAGGYKLCIEEMYNIKIEWVKIARFAKKEPFGFEIVPVENVEVCEEVFLKTLDLFRLLKEKVLGEPEASMFEDGPRPREVKAPQKIKVKGGLGF